MTTKRSRWSVSIGLVALALLTGLSADGFSQADKGRVYLKQKLKIPYALRDGSTVLKPDEYTLKIQSEGGTAVLTLLSKEGEPLLRSRGDNDIVPEQERDIKNGGRLRIFVVPDSKHPGGRLIVFVYDFIDRRGTFVRLRFRIAEATE